MKINTLLKTLMVGLSLTIIHPVICMEEVPVGQERNDAQGLEAFAMQLHEVSKKVRPTRSERPSEKREVLNIEGREFEVFRTSGASSFCPLRVMNISFQDFEHYVRANWDFEGFKGEIALSLMGFGHEMDIENPDLEAVIAYLSGGDFNVELMPHVATPANRTLRLFKRTYWVEKEDEHKENPPVTFSEVEEMKDLVGLGGRPVIHVLFNVSDTGSGHYEILVPKDDRSYLRQAILAQMTSIYLKNIEDLACFTKFKKDIVPWSVRESFSNRFDDRPALPISLQDYNRRVADMTRILNENRVNHFIDPNFIIENKSIDMDQRDLFKFVRQTYFEKHQQDTSEIYSSVLKSAQLLREEEARNGQRRAKAMAANQSAPKKK